MYLELADKNTDNYLYIPVIGSNKAYNVSPVFFDKLNDFEFSGVMEEILHYNRINLPEFIRERDKRRASIGLPPTNYNPEMGKKFGDWLKDTGKKIEAFFKPSDSGSTTPVTVTTPDGQTLIVQAPVKQDSAFTNILKGVAGAFGLYKEPTPVQQYQPQTNYTPLLLGAGAAFILYKLISKK